MSNLSRPMEIVLVAVSEKVNPSSLYPAGQLRMITQALFNRGLIRRRYSAAVGIEWLLTPAGRNIITRMEKENG